MIVTELYNGSGLGNQLWHYATTRTIALDNGYEFGIQRPEKFKGRNLFNLDMGKEVVGGTGPEGGPPTSLPNGIVNYYKETRVDLPNHVDFNISPVDHLMRLVPDNTKLEGNMQGEDYILHRRKEIQQWFKIKPEWDTKDLSKPNLCVINVRGGEYIGVRDLFLQPSYYRNAMHYMWQENPKMEFVIVTDDLNYCRRTFPDIPSCHEGIEWDYAVLHNARYSILSNSSFAWFPTWTSKVNKLTIAPKYWARHNVSNGYWCCGDALTRGWSWLDVHGRIWSYDICKSEKDIYNAEFKGV